MKTTSQSYQSPLRKLVTFFEQSRDQWKAKCQEAKSKVKQLKNKVNYLENSRARWKEKSKRLETKLAQMESQQSAILTQLNDLQNQVKKKPNKSDSLAQFNQVPALHQYSLGHIMLFLSFVLTAATSLRGAANSIKIVLDFLQLSLKAPSWSCGRLWLLRLGYYKLMRPKEQANDWVWIVDHTVQIGIEKCFVIVGIRLCNLPPPGKCLKHEDLEPISLQPVKQSNGQIVYEQLVSAISKTFVSDKLLEIMVPI